MEVEVLTAPPKMDILILRHEHKNWTKAQRAMLPDGIRDAHAQHIVIEFKYTEGFNESAVGQAFTYDLLFKSKLRKSDGEAQTFLVCSKSPRKKTLEHFGYEADVPGVFRSKQPLVEHVTVISLNELENTPHNAAFKAFASIREEKSKAFDFLLQKMANLRSKATLYSQVLYRYWFQEERSFMITELTSDEILKLGKNYKDSVIQSATPEERLNGLRPEERLNGLRPEERLNGLRPEERLNGLRPEEILVSLAPEVKEQLKALLTTG